MQPDSVFRAYPYITNINIIGTKQGSLSFHSNIVESSTLLKSLDSINYKISFTPLLFSILVVYAIVLSVLILANQYDFKCIKSQTKHLASRDKLFLSFSGVICIALCAFQFYIGFPGDIMNLDIIQALGTKMDNYAPVITAYLLKIIYFYFGIHTYYLFLFNIILFYAGLWFIIIGFYIGFKSYFSLALLILLAIGNLTLANFISMNYIGMANLIFCIYGIILFLILAKDYTNKIIDKILWIIIFILSFLALLWRHNAIFSVFPIFLIINFICLSKQLPIKAFLKQYLLCLFATAILVVSIAVFVPRILSDSISYPSKHLWLSQIAGACVPSDDSSCFKDEWYYPNRSFTDVKKAYKINPLDGDLYAEWRSTPIFKEGKFNDLILYWIKAILSHPRNYLSHEMRYISAMWFQNPRDDSRENNIVSVIQSPLALQDKSLSYRLNSFPKIERGITFSHFREAAYSLLYNHLLVLNHIIFILIGFFILIFSSVCLIKNIKLKKLESIDTTLLVFCFSSAFACVASAIIIAALSIVIYSRYMSPIAYISIISLVGFISFICKSMSSSLK